MAYEQVVAILGERLGSFLELMKKLLVTWELNPKRLLDHFHNEKQENLVGLLEGTHKVMAIRNGKVVQPLGTLSATIDLDASPTLPYGNISVYHHERGGKVTIEKRPDGSLYIDGRKFSLYRSQYQIGGKTIQGNELLKELVGKPSLNASLLDFLTANQGFVPDEMKRGDGGGTQELRTYFWGTLYAHNNDPNDLVVRCSWWENGKLSWRALDCNRHLKENWNSDDPAAMLES